MTINDVPADAIAHCGTYLEGMLLIEPEHSCEAIQKSLKALQTFVKAYYADKVPRSTEQPTVEAIEPCPAQPSEA
jgi:hypothetical protein